MIQRGAAINPRKLLWQISQKALLSPLSPSGTAGKFSHPMKQSFLQPLSLALSAFCLGSVSVAQAQESAISPDSALRLDSLRRVFQEAAVAQTADHAPQAAAEQQQQAIDRCMILTRQELRAPSFAKFADPPAVIQNGNRFKLSGMVEAMNGYGGYTALKYTCTLQKTGDVYLGSSALGE
jgi:hypothetical protein